MNASQDHLPSEMGTNVVMADATLVALGAIAERPWGLFTTAQAEGAGIEGKQLSRMASTGAIERVTHGVYRMAGAPTQDHGGDLRDMAGTRRRDRIPPRDGSRRNRGRGDNRSDRARSRGLLPCRLRFIVPCRKGTRLPGVRLRIRTLTPDDVIPAAGLPTLTVERTIADLIDLGTDESLVTDALRDAVRADKLVAPHRLVKHLSPAPSDAKPTAAHWPTTSSRSPGFVRKDGTVAEQTD